MSKQDEFKAFAAAEADLRRKREEEAAAATRVETQRRQQAYNAFVEATTPKNENG